jgi:hypothetical protein
MANERQWLQAEQTGEDELAERMFARAIADLPRVQPTETFVARTAQIAWRARARRHLLTRAAYAAAALLVSIIGIGGIYELMPFVPRLIADSALALSHALIWLVSAPAQGAGWWSLAESLGTAIADAITAPSTAAIITAVEVIGLLGIYAFRQLLRED